jgi:enoyl-CoA hydratase
VGDKSVILDITGSIACLTLSRPEHSNAIDAPMVSALREACGLIAEDKRVRVVLLTAKGDWFSRGWDWEALSAEGDSPLSAMEAHGIPADPLGCLSELPQPVVCAINGDAFGAGLELALACDVRLAVEDASFALPDISRGLLPLVGGTQRLPRLIGKGKALEMILTGEPIDAQEAMRIGLVGALARPEALSSAADALTSRIAERGPLAVRYAKEAVSRGLDMPLEQGLHFETDLTVILQTTEDRAEGVRAFIEKRKPEFKGR